MMKKYCLIFLIFLASCVKNTYPQEFWITNQQNEKIFLKIEGDNCQSPDKLVIIQHGLASNMEHPVVQTAKKAFLDKGYTVVTFDGRYSLGKSSGEVLNVRLSTFEDDLQTVVNWLKTQKSYSQPYVLVGHSLGGAAVISYAAHHPDQVQLIIPVTPVVSGEKWEKSCMKYMHDFCKKWKMDGFYNYQETQIPYQVVEESKTYDALQLAKKIKAKVFLIAAQEDTIIPVQDIENLNDALQTKKYLTIIPQSGHNFDSKQNQDDLYEAIIKILS